MLRCDRFWHRPVNPTGSFGAFGSLTVRTPSVDGNGASDTVNLAGVGGPGTGSHGAPAGYTCMSTKRGGNEDATSWSRRHLTVHYLLREDRSHRFESLLEGLLHATDHELLLRGCSNGVSGRSDRDFKYGVGGSRYGAAPSNTQPAST